MEMTLVDYIIYQASRFGLLVFILIVLGVSLIAALINSHHYEEGDGGWGGLATFLGIIAIVLSVMFFRKYGLDLSAIFR